MMEYYSRHEKEPNWVICRDVDGLELITEWSKSEGEKQISYIDAYVWNLKKNGTEEPICRTGI